MELDYYFDHHLHMIHRKEITELKGNGSIVCFEALVLPASEMLVRPDIFTVKLIHDPEISNKLGEILLMLTIRSLE